MTSEQEARIAEIRERERVYRETPNVPIEPSHAFTLLYAAAADRAFLLDALAEARRQLTEYGNNFEADGALITTLRAELAAAREALRPFARHAEDIDSQFPGDAADDDKFDPDYRVATTIYWSDMRRAASALSPHGRGEP